MRAQALKHTPLQGVCLLCAARLQLCPALSRMRTQKRFLSSTPVMWKPGAAAAALKDNEGSYVPVRKGSAHHRRSGGPDWASPLPPFGTSRSPQKPREEEQSGQTGYDRQGRTAQSPAASIFELGKSLRHAVPIKQDTLRNPNMIYRHADVRQRDLYATKIHEDKLRAIQERQNQLNGSKRPNWVCRTCLKWSYAQKQYCNNCGSSQPEPSAWLCHECKQTNDPEKLQCIFCQRPEQRLRNSYQKQVAASAEAFRPYRSSRQQVDQKDVKQRASALHDELNRNNGIFRPDWACKECGFQNHTIREYCGKCEARGPSLSDWICQRCQMTHKGESTKCEPCYESSMDQGMGQRQYEEHNWQHLRRKQSRPVSNTSAPQAPRITNADKKMFEEARAAEAARAQRRRETQSGGYVGLRGNNRENSRSEKAGTRPVLSEPDGIDLTTDLVAADTTLDTASGLNINSVTAFDPTFLEEPAFDETKRRSKKQWATPPKFNKADVSLPKDKPRQRVGRSALSRDNDDLEDEEGRDVAAITRERREKRKQAQEARKGPAPPTKIKLPEFISVSNLASMLRIRVEDFLRKMQDLGFDELNHDHVLDAETAGLIAAEFNFEAVADRQEDLDLLPRPPAVDKSVLPARPPVVTIMGHVDHGKTTMLDYLRKSSVATSEHGGITQHIGAFSVPMPGGRFITFLDTPGHEAFLAMRQRGANVTDIVILVVAADDSVKPQTIEAIKHAQLAQVPMIVAINKCDKEDADVERVKQDLGRYGVEIEDFGGDTQTVKVSGKTGLGMQELEDAVVALADILDMRAEADGPAEGWVLEATTTKAGRVATVLVRRGTLRPGGVIVAGTSWARVRGLRTEAGALISEAGPGTPVEIDGWRAEPSAGDEMLQASDEQEAKQVVAYRLTNVNRTQMAIDMAAVNESRRLEQEKRDVEKAALEVAKSKKEGDATVVEDTALKMTEDTKPKEQILHFILKAEVSGSLEALTQAITSLGTPEIRPSILRSSIGGVTESDIEHAAIANATVVCFNTEVEGRVRRQAEAGGVKIVEQSIIYRLVDEVRGLLQDKLPPTTVTKIVGEAEIGQIFQINTKGREKVSVAGCKIRNGNISKTKKVKVVRDGEVVYDGSLASLKNVKKDVQEMRKGSECGMSFENWQDFRVGDQVQSYEEIIEKRTL